MVVAFDVYTFTGSVVHCGHMWWLKLGWHWALRLFLRSQSRPSSPHMRVLMFVLPFSAMLVLNTLVVYRVRSHQAQRTALIAHTVIDNGLIDPR
jgi:hypothetical protein